MLQCPVCNSHQWITAYKINDWTILECEQCQFARIDPYPSEDSREALFELDKGYGKTFKKKRSFWGQFSLQAKRSFKLIFQYDKNKIFQKKITRHLGSQKEKSVLEVGCGDGNLIEGIHHRYQCTGIDISQRLIEKAHSKQLSANFIAGDYLTTDFKGMKFDVITIISVIEHIHNPLEVLKKSFGLLNEGGVLMLKTVNYSCVNRRVTKAKWTGFRPPDHVIYFNASNFSTMLKNVGFSRIKTFAFPLNDNMYCDAYK